MYIFGEELAEKMAAIVSAIIRHYSAVLLRMAIGNDVREIPNTRHPTNFLSEIDGEINERYRVEMRNVVSSFVFASEESEPEIWPSDVVETPEYLVLVDPLDTSELAVRGLHGHTHITVYSIPAARPVATVIGDMYHVCQLYIAYCDESGKQVAFLRTSDGQSFPLHCVKEKRLESSLVTNYLMRPQERFVPLSNSRRLIQALGRTGADGQSRGRIGVDFGSIGLCHIAAGFTDAMVEFAKGFALWDLYPGQHILEAAGGTVLGLNGTPLGLDLKIASVASICAAMDSRQKFVAAGSLGLAREVLSNLDHEELKLVGQPSVGECSL